MSPRLTQPARRVLVLLVISVIVFGRFATPAMAAPTVQFPNPPVFVGTLHDITYGGGLFAAVGWAGTIVTSADAVSWDVRSPGLNASFDAIAYGNGRFVTVGFGETSMAVSSLDGVEWTASTFGKNLSIRNIAFGNGRFVATGYVTDSMSEGSGLIATSSDGVHWTETQLPGVRGINTITFGHGRFIALTSQGAILTSIDALNWSETKITDLHLLRIAPGPDGFIALAIDPYPVPDRPGDPYVLSSPDGLTWSAPIAIPSLLNAYDLAYGAGHWVAVGAGVDGNDATMAVSTDGLIWQDLTIVPAPARASLYSIVHGGGQFVAVGTAGGNSESVVRSSSNGEAWRQVALNSTGTPERAVAGNGVFVAQAGPWQVLTSADAVSWEEAFSLDRSHFIGDITFGHGQFVLTVIRSTGIGRDGEVFTSPDARIWTKQYEDAGGIGGGLTYVAFGHGRLVAMPRIIGGAASADGVAWTPLTQNLRYVQGVAFGQGQFVAVGPEGQFWHSADALTWQLAHLVAPDMLISITYGRGRFIASGQSGELYTSTDGVKWHALPVTFDGPAAPNGLTYRITYEHGHFVGHSNLGYITSSDGSMWRYRGWADYDDGTCGQLFADVQWLHPGCGAVEYLAARHLVSGFPDGSYQPQRHLTRAELTKLVTGIAGRAPQAGVELSFSDVGGHWAAVDGYLQTAVALGAIAGFPDGTFRPDEPITRAQLAKIVAAVLQTVWPENVNAVTVTPYADVGPEDWHADWVFAAGTTGLVGSETSWPVWTDAALQAEELVTRWEAALVLANLWDQIQRAPSQ